MSDLTQHAMQKAKTVGDVVATSGVVATLVGWLPAIAAALSIVWTLIRIYETSTCQDFIKRLKERKK